MQINLNDIVKYDPRFLSDLYIPYVNRDSLEKIEMERLYDNYFSDHVINLNYSKNFCDVHLQRNDNLFYYVEKNARYLDNIKEFFPKFHKSLLPFYFSWDDSSLLCLNDSWSCLGWVDHFLKNSHLYFDEEIVLIHFDSHTDMANPLIAKHIETNEYYDLLRGNKIYIDGIMDFFIAIAIGSIGISNYISILPLFFKKVKVFHVNQFKGVFGEINYNLSFVEDEFFKSRHPYLLRMRNHYANNASNNQYPHVYFQAASIENFLHLIPKNKNIYLHFDMDYFNNFLDGSAEKYRNKNNIRSIDQQYQEIDKLMNCIGNFNKNILHTSIGLSPGFFPSEYWVPSTKYLINSLNNHGIHFDLKKVFPDFTVNLL